MPARNAATLLRSRRPEVAEEIGRSAQNAFQGLLRTRPTTEPAAN